MAFQDLERYGTLKLFVRQVVEGFITGSHKSPFHGFSVEFAEHRLYNSGESTRHIDWKLYARTDKLFVKRYEEETNLRCYLLVDQSGSMLFPVEGQGNLQQPNKLTFSVYAAALIVELLLRQRDAFALTLFSSGVDLQTDMRNTVSHQHYIYNLLEQMLLPVDMERAPQRTTAIAENLHLMAERMHRRSLVVLFTDAFSTYNDDSEALFDALRHLRHAKHEVLLFHTMDKAREVDFRFPNRPTQFIDMETGHRLKTYPSQVEAVYTQHVQAQVENLRRHALRYHIDYVPVDVAQGFEQVMLPYLLRRQRMC